MADAPVVLTRTTTVLGKRKASPLVLHLASSSSYAPTDSEIESDDPRDAHVPPTAAPSRAASKPLIIVNGALVKDTKRRYQCSSEGCEKAYTKPSRLEEHERSHTGERPFVCSTCDKSYLRETHLQAHTRSHLPETDRPFACEEPGCEKRFWTTQHLRVHGDVHKGTKPFKCSEVGCEAAFAKHHQLRSHVCATHAPPGTKSYICSHTGCTKSFPTNSKLRAHLKVHDDKRYTCVHPSCIPSSASSSTNPPTPTYYPTWTSLQHHIRTSHPPTCPHDSCNGRTFSTHSGLKGHLKIHEQREAEMVLDDEVEEEGEDDEERPKKKRRRGGELGRDWRCEVEGCGKDFKSKQALTTHTNVTHLGRRDHCCPHTSCDATFGYKHLLQRHLAKKHAASPSQSSSDGDDEDREDEQGMMDIDTITGKSYLTHHSLAKSNTLQCPFPHLPEAFSYSLGDTGIGGNCEYVFTRGYDLRRHLRGSHGVELEKDVVDDWVAGEKSRKRKGL
ncbi:hypothetical protein JAAARDRAFT_42006 [Jaapia argillacea MUCL 33604]|uniref:C2H2-type domain-containing protein n=1 Tax=Jaapia argillacea MUCL 33604 TaxID=933084 RepID=A0A067P6M5_9AGAM|nr:hypothetical protein JAAARDRAFT_42006 [Jaapia argillacea MUCL 33604]